MGTPSFTFRLERVRSLRERAEQQAREKLAKTLHHRLRGEMLLHQSQLAACSARELSLGVTLRGATAHDLIAAQAYVERTERGRVAAALELDRRDAEVEARRQALAAAAREREVVERLERRQRADHDAEQTRLEQIELDEIALNVHRRGPVAA